MRTLAALSLAALAAGCNIGNDTVLVATLVQSPTAPASLVPSPPPPVTVAEVFLAHVDTGLGSPPTQSSMRPISGATVKVVKTVGATVTETPLAESPAGSGNYQSTAVAYAAGATFRFVAQVGSDQYWGEVTSAPAAPTFDLNGSNPLAYANYSLIPASVTLNRTSCAAAPCNIGIYGVWPVPGNGTYNGGGNPSCTNTPSDAAGILNLAFLNDLAWRTQSFTLTKATPQACFPSLGTAAGAYPGGYVVGLADLKKGTLSGNTSPFSAVYVGASGAGAITVAAP